MDEILVANFHVLNEIAETEHHDLWVGDEAWELDHFLHENPELKRSAYAWLTDFVGFLPMPDGPGREAELTADHNAQMLEQVERHPRLRDAALFVGDVDDVVPDTFGPGLPGIREWTSRHYAFPGYVTGFTPIDERDRAGIREELGWADGEPVCLVTAGGTGVGLPLLRRVLAAVPEAARLVPGLRTVVVTGPRIDPATLPPTPGVEVHGWVPDLYRRLAACDLGDHPRRAHHDDGADGEPPPVPLRAVATALRAEPARAAPARPVPGRAADELGRARARTRWPRRSRRRSAGTSTTRRSTRAGRHGRRRGWRSCCRRAPPRGARDRRHAVTLGQRRGRDRAARRPRRARPGRAGRRASSSAPAARHGIQSSRSAATSSARSAARARRGSPRCRQARATDR